MDTTTTVRSRISLICMVSLALAGFACGGGGDDTRGGGDGGTSSGRDGGSMSRVDGGGGGGGDGSMTMGMLCTDECEFAGDGECDDGGPGSMFGVCAFGTDCMDCGPRNPGDCVPDCEGATCGDDGCGGTCGSCDSGTMCMFGECVTCGCDGIACGMDACGMMECGTCTEPATCVASQCRMPMCMGRTCGSDGAGGTCGDMMGGCPDMQGCRDGTCRACGCGMRQCGDDGCGTACGPNMGACPEGQMCDYLAGTCSAMPPAACNNTCRYAGDNECDDGRMGSHTSLCELGTDCEDCGPAPAMM